MTEQGELLRTPLHSLHQELGARLVPFAGYEMPVQYPAGILKEHNHTRAAAGLFDVSHMGQARLEGDSAAEALEALVPVDVVGLAPGRQRYALFTNDKGGILDDLMVTNAGDHLFIVVNAACKAQDFALLEKGRGSAGLTLLEDRALLALQGPEAAAVLARFAPEVAEMTFMEGRAVTLRGAEAFLTRSGYTGEDGFEISLPAGEAEDFARALLAEDEVEPIGLGARDSLRLEAGLCLYGHDIDETTTPVEAALSWALSKARRKGGERPGGYPGADVILEQLERGAARRRVGLKPEGRAPVREGTLLQDEGGAEIGVVTSGGFGPTVGGPVAMGYLPTERARPGEVVQALLRGKPQPATVARLPFIEQRYHRK